MDGLYHMRIEPLGGGRTINAGVIVIRHGQLLGGDAFFYYVGSCSASGGSLLGEFTTRQHTKSGDFKPAFGVLDVPIVLNGNLDGPKVTGTAEVRAPDAPASFTVSLQRIVEG